jgi:hypothetical protein
MASTIIVNKIRKRQGRREKKGKRKKPNIN